MFNLKGFSYPCGQCLTESKDFFSPQPRKAPNVSGKCTETHVRKETTEKMNIDKSKILDNICYTELVYERINKKLKTNNSKLEIEKKLLEILKQTSKENFEKKGKNFYATNIENNIIVTINSNTFRIITVDRIVKK